MADGKKGMPPAYLLLTTLLMWGADQLAPGFLLFEAPQKYAGGLLILVGIFMVVWNATRFAKVGTTIKPFQESTFLLQRGLYRYSRNPIYLGMVAVLFGVAVVLGSLTSFLLIPFFVWVIQARFIVPEEQMLEQTFGEPYLQYKARVRRWI